MLATFRALRKDLFELQKSGRGLVLAVIAPAAAVVLVGQLSVNPPTMKLLVAGAKSEVESKDIQDLKNLLRQLPNVSVDIKTNAPSDPLRAATRGGYDLVVVPNALGSGKLVGYSADTEPARVGHLIELANNIERTLALIRRSEPPPAQPSATAEADSKNQNAESKQARDAANAQHATPESGETEVVAGSDESAPSQNNGPSRQQTDLNSNSTDSTDTAQKLSAAGVIPPQSLYLYYPRAQERRAGFLPMTIALVLCFFPFIIAAPSLIREKESHTIEIALTAPGLTHAGLFAAKYYLPMLVASAGALSMFVCAETFYQYYAKGQTLHVIAFIFLAVSATAFLGLAVSTVVRSTTQAAAASAVYFVSLLLFSGFFVSLDQSALPVRLIASAFPLATLDEILKTWMFGADLADFVTAPAFWKVLAQTIVFGCIAWFSYRRVFVRRL